MSALQLLYEGDSYFMAHALCAATIRVNTVIHFFKRYCEQHWEGVNDVLPLGMGNTSLTPSQCCSQYRLKKLITVSGLGLPIP